MSAKRKIRLSQRKKAAGREKNECVTTFAG